MADETTQTGEDMSWWDLDIFPDSELPSTSFDEPLEWPETLDWGELSAPGGALQFPGTVDLESEPIFPPTSDPEPSFPEAPAADTQWQPAGDDGDSTMAHVTVLSGLGGGASPPVAKAAEQTAHERLPDSLWAADSGAGGSGNGVTPLVTSTMAAPTFYAEPDRGGGGWRRRFDIRHGNAAIIALISCVSLILLGMFMSVRARNELPDASQTRTTSDQIQVQVPLNTVPLTTTVTTTPAAINIADLIPPAEDATTSTAGSGAGSGSGSGSGGSGSSSPATTAAPARSTPAAGGGTGASQPAAQPTNTTAAPQTAEPPEATTPPAPPVTQTTPTPRRTMPTFPSMTPTVPDDDRPSMPSIPSIPGFPAGFGN